MAIEFRTLRRDDLELLGSWLSAPHVKRWWPEPSDPAQVRATYLPAIEGDDPTEVFVVVLDGVDAGLIQRYALSDYPTWQSAVSVGAATSSAIGIDYLLGDTAALGRGNGARMIASFTDASFDQLVDVSSIVVGVQQANVASWRALERAGFTRTWEGTLDSDDPSDEGPAYVYVRTRPAPGGF